MMWMIRLIQDIQHPADLDDPDNPDDLDDPDDPNDMDDPDAVYSPGRSGAVPIVVRTHNATMGTAPERESLKIHLHPPPPHPHHSRWGHIIVSEPLVRLALRSATIYRYSFLYYIVYIYIYI